MKETTSQRLNQIMSEQNLKQVDILNKSLPFQKKLNVKMGKSALSQYVNGKSSPDQYKLTLLAHTLDVSEPWLMGFDVPRDRKTSETNSLVAMDSIYNQLSPDRRSKVINYAQAQLDEQNNIIHIDEYQEIYLQSKVSAGTGILDLDPENAETISYKGKLPNYYDFAFKVAGNSMEPIFFDGDIIFVEKMNDVISGALMVVQIDEEAFIKKVYRENNCLRLVSLNKNYKDIIVDGKHEIRIVGKVVF